MTEFIKFLSENPYPLLLGALGIVVLYIIYARIKKKAQSHPEFAEQARKEANKAKWAAMDANLSDSPNLGAAAVLPPKVPMTKAEKKAEAERLKAEAKEKAKNEALAALKAKKEAKEAKKREKERAKAIKKGLVPTETPFSNISPAQDFAETPGYTNLQKPQGAKWQEPYSFNQAPLQAPDKAPLQAPSDSQPLSDLNSLISPSPEASLPPVGGPNANMSSIGAPPSYEAPRAPSSPEPPAIVASQAQLKAEVESQEAPPSQGPQFSAIPAVAAVSPARFKATELKAVEENGEAKPTLSFPPPKPQVAAKPLVEDAQLPQEPSIKVSPQIPEGPVEGRIPRPPAGQTQTVSPIQIDQTQIPQKMRTQTAANPEKKVVTIQDLDLSYEKTSFMTPLEITYYKLLRAALKQYLIFPRVSSKAVVKATGTQADHLKIAENVLSGTSLSFIVCDVRLNIRAVVEVVDENEIPTNKEKARDYILKKAGCLIVRFYSGDKPPDVEALRLQIIGSI
ncbi:MAG: DUF2726 domain-containing protein [Deltaproteobacteria bacterium]|jgi:hypothetical protein|nr:DUF2726 domain-containing protein [Deltaproteobacteria bacterium]